MTRRSLPPVRSRWRAGDLTFGPGTRIGITLAVTGAPLLLLGWAIWEEGLVGFGLLIVFIIIWFVTGVPAVLRDVWANETVYVPEPFEIGPQPSQPLPSPLPHLGAAPPPPDPRFSRN